MVEREAGSWSYPLGTDKLGRDNLSRIIYGARVSLTVALVSIIAGGIVGTTLGLVAGYFGGWWDNVIMRLVDIKLSLPSILLALVLVAALGPSFATVIVVIALVLWTRYARLVRGEVLSLKHQDFVARAQVAGCSTARILFPPSVPQRGEHHYSVGHLGGRTGDPAGVYSQLPGGRASPCQRRPGA